MPIPGFEPISLWRPFAAFTASLPFPAAIQDRPEAVELQLRAWFRQDFPSLAIGIIIASAGVLAVATHLLRGKSRGRLLLWFGLFAGCYGFRALANIPVIWLLTDAGPRWWSVFVGAVNYLIIIPALLFAQELYGKGWKEGIRWLVWLFSGYAFAAIALGAVAGDPNAAPDPAVGLLILLPAVLVIGHAKGYRPPRIPDAKTLVAGSAAFILTVVNEHLVNSGWLPWQLRFESVGFLILLGCLGYVAVRQFVANERQLLAIEEEMHAASRIQASILPRQIPEVKGLRIFARYAPMAAVGGDFYGFLPADDRRLGILVADVMGHGVPAALVASMIRVGLASQSENASDPSRVMAELNELICSQAPGQYCTACHLFLDAASGRAFYSAAGHPPLLAFKKALGRAVEYEDNGLMLGVRSGERYPSLSIDLAPGDRLLLYTDGITETVGPADEFFGAHRLQAFMATHQSLDSQSFVEALLEELERWSGGPGGAAQNDDLTLVAVDVAAS